MLERFDKKEIFEFCRIRNLMVRLEVIRSTARMPDHVHSEAVILPVGCDKARECKKRGIRCIVFDKDNGEDPCPEVWKGEF